MDMIFLLKCSEGRNSVKYVGGFAYCPIVLYICTKVCENISKGCRVTEET